DAPLLASRLRFLPLQQRQKVTDADNFAALRAATRLDNRKTALRLAKNDKAVMRMTGFGEIMPDLPSQAVVGFDNDVAGLWNVGARRSAQKLVHAKSGL